MNRNFRNMIMFSEEVFYARLKILILQYSRCTFGIRANAVFAESAVMCVFFNFFIIKLCSTCIVLFSFFLQVSRDGII